jgi:short-subunit dehydrogenase
VVAAVDKLDMPVAALVNNAGFGDWGPFAEQDVDRLNRMVDLNCRAVVDLSRRLLDRVKDARGGVLTVASTASFQPGPGMTVYHASKAFALFFSVALREELRGSGVRVTALCPGPVPTGFGEAAGVGDVEDMLRVRLSSVSADKVARRAWRGLKRNEAVVVPGTVNRVGAFGAKLSPITLSTRITRSALGALDRTGAKKS